MAFKKFENQGGKSSSPFPIVSIWKRGAIGFNLAAIKLCKLDKFGFVEIYFDKNTNRAGFKFILEKTEYSRHLSKRPSGCTICIRAFLNHYKIDCSVAKKYDLTFDEENGLFVIQF